jgi:REP element-mobilizing transposase RayT
MGRTRVRKRHVQLTLETARKETGRGGWRRNAGRKKKPGAVSHDTRHELDASHPQHITLRLVDNAPRLARDYLMKIIRPAIAQSHNATFRIVEFNVLNNHLHLMVEAADKLARARGMQGLGVRLAKRINRAVKRKGKLFAHRYHARALSTPREVRNALRYVLLNRKHHAASTKFDRYWVDPFSSAAWFTGWAEPISQHAWTVKHLVGTPPPTKPPSGWLLATGWKKHGLLRIDERPA